MYQRRFTPLVRHARFAALLLLSLISLSLSSATQFVTPTTCQAEGACPEPQAYGHQPTITELSPSFESAGTNRLPQNTAPVLPTVGKGYPPSQSVPPYVPCILLKAIGYVESPGWKQFEADYGQDGYTVVGATCGYGIMQITYGMDGSVPAYQPSRVAAEPVYNIGTGAYLLADAWNHVHNYIGSHDPYTVEDWYYALWAYNTAYDTSGHVTSDNNPNNPKFNQTRGQWPCNPNADRRGWPYQELVWSCATTPPDPISPNEAFWPPATFTLPDRSLITYPVAPEHIDRPEPSHGSCSVIHLPLIMNNYPACATPIQNGGFENGSNFYPWITTGGTWISSAPAYSGSYSAWLGYTSPLDTLAQTIQIPSTGPTGKPVASAYLSYYWQILTEEPDHPHDYFDAMILNPYGTLLASVQSLNDGSTPIGSWQYTSFGMNAFIGQDVQIYFQATTNGSAPTSFYVDEVVVRACESF